MAQEAPSTEHEPRVTTGTATDLDWAEAIAERLAGEWGTFMHDDPGFVTELTEVLTEALKDRPELLEQLIGSELIEEDYFEPTD